ncbi:MAG TPA: lytic murein transglycosylase [Cyanobacteria bacterium UBA8156]|nr:lytic murein transglycosylase [Cyanobacteria bacterium UBA8156]
MLKIQNLHYHPPATPRPILQGVSLELRPQELVTVVGPSGSGKTTLLEILAGFVDWQRGTISWLDQELLGDQLQQVCGLVFQFPERHFCGMTVLEELRLGHPDLDRVRIAEALAAVGLSHLAEDAAPESLSGGQQRRLALAVQLIRQPGVLLLDEPMAGLDWSVRQQAIALLAELKQRWSLLVVTHEPEELDPIADRSWRLEGGVLQERGR